MNLHKHIDVIYYCLQRYHHYCYYCNVCVCVRVRVMCTCNVCRMSSRDLVCACVVRVACESHSGERTRYFHKIEEEKKERTKKRKKHWIPVWSIETYARTRWGTPEKMGRKSDKKASMEIYTAERVRQTKMNALRLQPVTCNQPQARASHFRHFQCNIST